MDRFRILLGRHALPALLAAASAWLLPACGDDRSPSVQEEFGSVGPQYDTNVTQLPTPAVAEVPKLIAVPLDPLPEPEPEPILPTWIVLLKEKGFPEALGGRHDLTVLDYDWDSDLALLEGNTTLGQLLADGAVAAAERNDPVGLSAPLDLIMGFFEGQWSEGEFPRQSPLALLQLDEVHAITTGHGVRVAVLDTGVDPNHPHLAQRLELHDVRQLGLPLESANGLDDDHDGTIDEGYGHGTHVAGIVATVSPDATILPYKVLGEDGIGTDYQVAVALAHAGRSNVDIVNMSLSLTANSTVVSQLLDALANAGVHLVCAAGNNGGLPVFPSTHQRTLGVAATLLDDALAAFSAFGAVEFGAPGAGIVSSYPGDRLAVADGTSMACAVVSGSVALLMDDTLTNIGDPVAALSSQAAPVIPANAVLFGRVDPHAALGL